MLGKKEQECPVDILLATYNGGAYLSELIDSLRAQTYSSWRILFSDDGSNDETLSLLSSYMAGALNIADVSSLEKKRSSKNNFLYLLGRSTAPYAIFCDQDDVWLPNKLEESVKRMKELEARWGTDVPLLVYSDSKVVDKNLNMVSESFVASLSFSPVSITLPQILVSNVVQGCTMLMNRPLVSVALSLLNKSEFPFHDHLVAAVAFSTGYVSFIEKPLMLYRQHGDNTVGVDESLSVLNKIRGGLHTVRENDWRREVAYKESAFSRRARSLLDLGSSIPESKRIKLRELASFHDMKTSERLSLIKRYGLLRHRGVYGRLCQVAGMLLA